MRKSIEPLGSLVRRYTRSELIADGVVHVLGLAFGLGACIGLAVVALPDAELLRLATLGVYALGLLAMLGCSALYNNLPGNGRWKELCRRFDHAAIFVMIAGTYTPFALIAIGGAWGIGLFVFVWFVAAAGVVAKLFYPRRFERASVVAYLLLGWTILVAIGPLWEAVSIAGLVLLAVGGALYSLGVVFHVWRRLPYQNAVWHGFVLAAAACHYAAVLSEVAIVA